MRAKIPCQPFDRLRQEQQFQFQKVKRVFVPSSQLSDQVLLPKLAHLVLKLEFDFRKAFHRQLNENLIEQIVLRVQLHR